MNMVTDYGQCWLKIEIRDEQKCMSRKLLQLNGRIFILKNYLNSISLFPQVKLERQRYLCPPFSWEYKIY